MFTVEVKIMGRLILARSCNRIAGASGGPCLYVTDDGRFIEHHYDAGAAALATLLLASVQNILKANYQAKADRWERKRYLEDPLNERSFQRREHRDAQVQPRRSKGTNTIARKRSHKK